MEVGSFFRPFFFKKKKKKNLGNPPCLEITLIYVMERTVKNNKFRKPILSETAQNIWFSTRTFPRLFFSFELPNKFRGFNNNMLPKRCK